MAASDDGRKRSLVMLSEEDGAALAALAIDWAGLPSDTGPEGLADQLEADSQRLHLCSLAVKFYGLGAMATGPEVRTLLETVEAQWSEDVAEQEGEGDALPQDIEDAREWRDVARRLLGLLREREGELGAGMVA